MLNDNLTKLKCPYCGADISKNNNSLICNGERKHCFDISSDGYVNLVPTSGNGDSKEAVNARKLFLDSGHYESLRLEIENILSDYSINSGLVADMGCGDGYYSVNLAKNDELFVFGCDLSKFAVKAASKRAKALNLRDKTLYTVSSVFEAPLKDSSCAAVLNLFAPCTENEYSRILDNSGILVVVGAGENHLLELKNIIYETTRLNDERKDLPRSMKLCEKRTLYYKFSPSVEERDALFKMTPYYYKTSISDKQKLNVAPVTEIGAEFKIYIYKK